MYAVVGIVVLLVMVFGGFALTGGALGPVMAAVPHEMMIIGGAAVCAKIAGNTLHELKAIIEQETGRSLPLNDPRLIQHDGSIEQLAAFGLRPAA